MERQKKDKTSEGWEDYKRRVYLIKKKRNIENFNIVDISLDYKILLLGQKPQPTTHAHRRIVTWVKRYCICWVIPLSEGEDRNLFELLRKPKFLGEGLIDKLHLLGFRPIFLKKTTILSFRTCFGILPMWYQKSHNVKCKTPTLTRC